MTTENTTSPAIPPPQEQEHSVHQSLPQIPFNSTPISAPKISIDIYVHSNGIVTDQSTNEIESPSYYKYLYSKEYADKLRSYEAEIKQCLVTHYFSGKDPNGEDIFEGTTIIDGETIRSSKWPCTRVYADLDVSHPEPDQPLVEEEKVEEGEEEEEGEDEDDDDDDDDDEEDEDEEDEDEEMVDSAPTEISPGMSNGVTISEKKSS